MGRYIDLGDQNRVVVRAVGYEKDFARTTILFEVYVDVARALFNLDSVEEIVAQHPFVMFVEDEAGADILPFDFTVEEVRNLDGDVTLFLGVFRDESLDDQQRTLQQLLRVIAPVNLALGRQLRREIEQINIGVWLDQHERRVDSFFEWVEGRREQ